MPLVLDLVWLISSCSMKLGHSRKEFLLQTRFLLSVLLQAASCARIVQMDALFIVHSAHVTEAHAAGGGSPHNCKGCSNGLAATSICDHSSKAASVPALGGCSVFLGQAARPVEKAKHR